MKKSLHAIFFCLVLFPLVSLAQGDEHGSGDPIRILFEQGRLNAVGVIERVDIGKLPTYLTKYLHRDEYDWLLKHKRELSDDIGRSAYRWGNDLPTATSGSCGFDTCGCTTFTPGAEILFSFKTCRNSTHTRQDAGQLLIHESVHHLLGADEERADRIATAFYIAWNAMGHSEQMECKLIPQGMKSPYPPIWNGRELVFFYLDQKVGFFNPAMNSWRYVTPTNSFPYLAVESPPYYLYELFFFGDSVVFYKTKYLHDVRIPQGMVYRLDANRWEEISQVDRMAPPAVPPAGMELGPTSREGTNHKKLGDKLAVWQPMTHVFDSSNFFRESYLLGAPGGILNPKSNQWTPLPDDPSLSARYGQHAVSGGNYLFVWEGYGYDYATRSYETMTSARVFDLVSQKWRPISNVGSPLTRILPFNSWTRTVWTGDELIVYSSDPKTNAIYNPSRDEWRPMSQNGFPILPGQTNPSPGIWTGTDLLILGNGGVSSYSPFTDKWVSGTNVRLPFGRMGGEPSLYWTNTELIIWNADSYDICGLYL